MPNLKIFLCSSEIYTIESSFIHDSWESGSIFEIYYNSQPPIGAIYKGSIKILEYLLSPESNPIDWDLSVKLQQIAKNGKRWLLLTVNRRTNLMDYWINYVTCLAISLRIHRE